MLKVAMLLPEGANVSPEVVFVDDHNDISREIGDVPFDCVYMDLGEGAERAKFCGFVRDEFLFDGSKYNYLATNLFKREILGPCLVAWVLNAEHEDDGHIYDLPDRITEILSTHLVAGTAEAYNTSVILGYVTELSVKYGYWTEEQATEVVTRMHRASVEGEPDEDAIAQFNAMMDWAGEHNEVAPLIGFMLEAMNDDDTEGGE